MTDTEQAAPRLSDAQAQEVIGLLREADTTELKLTVPEEGQKGWRSTIVALGMDPMDAFLRQVFFFDTPALDLDSAGVVVRARRTQGKPDDSVVKLRPVVPSELPDEVREPQELRGRGRRPAGRVRVLGVVQGRARHDGVVKPIIAGGRQAPRALHKQQRAFYAEHARRGSVSTTSRSSARCSC